MSWLEPERRNYCIFSWWATYCAVVDF